MRRTRLPALAVTATFLALIVFGALGAGSAWAQSVPADTNPDPFSFTTEFGVTAGATVTSDEVTISGINTAASFRYALCRLYMGASYTTTGATCTLVKNGSDVTGTSTTVVNGDKIRVKVVAHSTTNGEARVQVLVGPRGTWFTARTGGIDSTPEPFSFTDQTGVTAGTTVTSNEITVAGVSHATQTRFSACRFVAADGAVTTTGATCTLVKDGADVSAAISFVRSNDKVRVKVVANSAPLGKAEAQLEIGARRAWFRVTTEPPDTTPDNFAFADQTGAAPGSTVTSSEVTVGGVSTATPLSYQSCRFVSADGMTTTTTGAACTLVKNGADVTGASTTVVNTDTVRIKVAANSAPFGKAEVQVTMGTLSTWFRVTTRGVAPFSFVDRTARFAGSTVTSGEVTVAGIAVAVNMSYRSCRFVGTDGAVTTTGAACTLVKNGADVTGASTTVVNGDRVRVKVVAHGAPLGRAQVQVSIGAQSAWFSAVTRGEEGDTTPAPFVFIDRADAEPGAVVTSNAITVTGLGTTTLARLEICRFLATDGITRTTTGAVCTLVKNGADVTGTTTTVVNGDRLRVKVVANSVHGASARVKLNIGSEVFGSESDWFSATTRAVGMVLARGDGTPFGAGGARLEIAAGGSTTYRVGMEASPLLLGATVDISVVGGGVSVSPNRLTFTSTNWNLLRTVTVTAAAGGADGYAIGAVLGHDLTGGGGGFGIGHRQYVSVAVTGGGTRIRSLEPGATAVYDVGGQTVTVETRPGVSPGAEFGLPATPGGDLALTLEPPVDGLPSSGSGYEVVSGSAVDVSVTPMTSLPPEGMTVCLPAGTGDADGILALLRYTDGVWTEAPGSSYVAARRLVCASGVRDFGQFAVGGRPKEDPEPETAPEEAAEPASARLKALNESVLPEIGRATWGSALDAVTGRLASPEAGEATAEASLAKVAGALQANERAFEDDSASWKEVLGGESFVFALGAGEGGAQDGDGAAAVWGAGYWRKLAREEGALDWSGELFAAHLGVDLAARSDLRAGLAVSWFTSEIDYRTGAAKGSHESRMTMLSPYLGWDLGGGTRLWGALGLGRGEIEIKDDDNGEESADSRFLAAGAGGAMRVWADGALNVDAKGSLEATRYEVKDNGDAIKGVTVETRRARLAAEGTRAYVLVGGATLTPTLEVGARWDDGDGATGGGVEAGGGLEWADPSRGLTLEARGRALVAHSSDLDDWGLSGAVRLDPGAAGRGLSFRLVPSWGTNESGVARLWEDDAVVFPDDHDGTREPAAEARLEIALGYGLPAFSGAGTATPYTGITSVRDGAGEVHVGTRLDLRAGLDLDLRARRDRAHGGGVHANVVELRVNARW